jgi:hypothetical protein
MQIFDEQKISIDPFICVPFLPYVRMCAQIYGDVYQHVFIAGRKGDEFE